MSAFYNPVVFGGDVAGPASNAKVAAISGTSPIVVTPRVLQWLDGTAITIGIAPSTTGAGVRTTIKGQNALPGSGATGGDLLLQAGAGDAGIDGDFFCSNSTQSQYIRTEARAGGAGDLYFKSESLGWRFDSLIGPMQPVRDNANALGLVGGFSWSTVAAYKHEFTNTADPATPSVGAVAYGKAGALWVIGTSGTKTQVAPA
jgi:hypothetical protein